jgi:hypothetical protein
MDETPGPVSKIPKESSPSSRHSHHGVQSSKELDMVNLLSFIARCILRLDRKVQTEQVVFSFWFLRRS